MSTQSGHAYLPLSPVGAEAVTASAKPGWLKAIEFLGEKLRQRPQLQALVELDDRLLADIGITREQALAAATQDRWI